MKYETLEPRRATVGSAGYDLYSPRRYELKPGEWTLIDTLVALTDNDACMDFGHWWLDVRPRSSLARKYGLCFRGGNPVIDMDYRDTIKLVVGVEEPFTLEAGERFAQFIIQPFGVFFCEKKPTEKREGGFGSTGRS